MSRERIFLFFFLIFWVNSSFIYAQSSLLIKGKVSDKETHEPLPEAIIIGLAGQHSYGGTTNSLGEFTFQLKPEIDTLKFALMGYQTLKIPTKNLQSYQEISLQPVAKILDEIVIHPLKPEAIIREAVAAIPQNYVQNPFQIRGFYREKIQNSSQYLSISEAIFESQLFPDRKKGDKSLLRLVQGRRSEQVETSRIFEDFHPSGGPNLLANQAIEVNLPDYLNKNNFSKYEYRLDSISHFDNHEVYIIHFDQRNGLKESLSKGIIYIETDKKAIIQIESELSPRGLSYLKSLTGSEKIAAAILGIDFQRKSKKMHLSYANLQGKWLLHEAKFDIDIDYKQPKKSIDETLHISGDFLVLSVEKENFKPIEKDERWAKNQLMLNLPGEFDEDFWGTDNFIQPEASLNQIIAQMNPDKNMPKSRQQSGNWQVFQGNLCKAYYDSTGILLKPLTTFRWKDEERGSMIWQGLQGDFMVSVHLKINQLTDTTAAPDKGFQSAGIIIRNQASEQENYVLFALGTMGNPNLKLASQSTINGQSAIFVNKIAEKEVDLMISCQNGELKLSYRTSSDKDWTLLKTFQRNDFPTKLQLGLTCQSSFAGREPHMKPDIQAKFSQLKITQQP